MESYRPKQENDDRDDVARAADRSKQLVRYHEVALRLLYNELNFVFQRAGFFLLANSFLIAAFVAILLGLKGEDPPDATILPWVATGVGVVGILITVFQALMGRRNAEKARDCMRYVFNIEKEPEFPSYAPTYRQQENSSVEIRPPLTDVFSYLDPTQKAHGFVDRLERRFMPAPFAWLVFPALFIVVWIAGVVVVWLPLPHY